MWKKLLIFMALVQNILASMAGNGRAKECALKCAKRSGDNSCHWSISSNTTLMPVDMM